MADVVLFHSAYGLRPAVRALAQAWRDEGHLVATPDLYEGKVASALDTGLALRDSIGRDELLRRARAAVKGARPGTILAGLSLGAALAQRVAASDARFSRLLLLHGVAEVPPRLPAPWTVEAHVAANDPWAPGGEVESWRRSLTDLGARVEVAVYTGGHLFTDPDLPDHDPVSAARVRARALLFLAG